MNPITMKMIQPLAFKGQEDSFDEEADVSTADAPSQEEVKLERQPKEDEVVKTADKKAEKAPEKVTPPKKPEVSMKDTMKKINEDAQAVAEGVNGFANSAATTIVGITGGAVVVGNAAKPAMDNLQKAGEAFKPMADGLKSTVQKFTKKGAQDAVQAGENGTKAALASFSNINLGSIVKKIRSIF